MGCGIADTKNKISMMRMETKSERLTNLSTEMEKHVGIEQINEQRQARRQRNNLKEEDGDLVDIKPNMNALKRNENENGEQKVLKVAKSQEYKPKKISQNNSDETLANEQNQKE